MKGDTSVGLVETILGTSMCARILGNYSSTCLKRIKPCPYASRVDLVLYLNACKFPIRFAWIPIGYCATNLFEVTQETLKFLTQMWQVADLDNVSSDMSKSDFMHRFHGLAGLIRYTGLSSWCLSCPSCEEAQLTHGIEDRMLFEHACTAIYIPSPERVFMPFSGTSDLRRDIGLFFSYNVMNIDSFNALSGFVIYSSDNPRGYDQANQESDIIQTASEDVLRVFSNSSNINGPATNPFISWKMYIDRPDGSYINLEWISHFSDHVFAMPNTRDTKNFVQFPVPSEWTNIRFEMYQNNDDHPNNFEVPLNTLGNPKNLKETIQAIHEFLKSINTENACIIS